MEEKIDLAYQTWCSSSISSDVTRVLDGDTLEINQNGIVESIRLLGIDAPEIAHTESEVSECYGDDARYFLEDWVLDENIKIDFDVECTDIFGRTLGWIFLRGQDPAVASIMEQYELHGLEEDGSYELLINEMMARLGYATIYQNEVDKSERYKEWMETAEELAEAERLGGWADCNDF